VIPHASDLQRLNVIIADFCHDVVIEPLCFFSEADLQSMLFARLLGEFATLVGTAITRGPGSKGTYRTGLVHREYGAGKGRRIDISIFAAEDIARIDDPQLTAGNKYLEPRFVIELGTEKTLDTPGHIANDIRKLSRAQEQGYLIHFFRDTAQADIGTERRRKTEQRLKEMYRLPVNKAELPPNVKMLCFLLRLAHTHRKIYGKCELFSLGSRRWEPVNLTRVRQQALRHLQCESGFVAGA